MCVLVTSHHMIDLEQTIKHYEEALVGLRADLSKHVRRPNSHTRSFNTIGAFL